MTEFTKKAFANDLVTYLNEGCSAFHAVEASKKRLVEAGFVEIQEKDAWSLAKGGKYFFSRAGTTLVAFTIGQAYEAGNGFTMIGAHSDSPCLRIKAVATKQKQEYLMLNTQPYGGGLWHTWFDRDLGLAGRVLVREESGAIISRLVRINEPIARIPNLAIHLSDRSKPGFAPNLQDHGCAILTMKHTGDETKETPTNPLFHPFLVQLICKAISVAPADIVDMELQLIDIQPSCLGGACEELLISGRLDNLCSSYQAFRAITDVGESFDTQENVHIACMFDHEEIGSGSGQGAGSSLFMDTLRRINDQLTDATHHTFMRALRKSYVVSSDMAHALHPNYTEKHDPTMAPKINQGMVIKHNANQRYATSSVSATMFREFAKLEEVPVQEFSIRADGACGSTIGPIIATLSGILTVDVGTPQYSMHSIREMMGSEDAYNGYKTLLGAYRHHPTLAKQMSSLDI
jgi:aspartyl aminopeptidase